MRIRILGSAAGGGVPQWNCRCSNCEAARAGSSSVRPRTQSSVAISADGQHWILLNVSPDIRQQILAFRPLGPPEGSQRGQSILGCVLTDAEIDHTFGLPLLREGNSFFILSTTLVRSWLNRYLPLEPLLHCFAKPLWVELRLNNLIGLRNPGAESAFAVTELAVSAFEVEAHLPRFVTEEANAEAGSVIGLLIHDLRTGGKLVYAPCVGSLSEPLMTIAREADAVLIDGTFWSDDEPLRFGARSAMEMGHLPVSGPQGSLAWLRDLPVQNRVYVHINNTNPMLNESGAEYRLVNGYGVRIGADGDMLDV
jgi:pyrroloquinoline quinone biosynthesis protein B